MKKTKSKDFREMLRRSLSTAIQKAVRKEEMELPEKPEPAGEPPNEQVLSEDLFECRAGEKSLQKTASLCLDSALYYERVHERTGGERRTSTG